MGLEPMTVVFCDTLYRLSYSIPSLTIYIILRLLIFVNTFLLGNANAAPGSC